MQPYYTKKLNSEVGVPNNNFVSLLSNSEEEKNLRVKELINESREPNMENMVKWTKFNSLE